MALNTMRYPVTRIRTRGLAAKAEVKTSETPRGAPEVNTTALPNKILVSSLDLCGPLSRVSVVFRVGTRQETVKNMGILHVIRSMAGFGTQNCTTFAIWKNLQQNGAKLICTGDRELTGFHLVCARNKMSDSLKYLSAVVATPAFKPWEVKDNTDRLKYEIAGLSPQAKVIDTLHKAAFRTGLGNSLFIEPDRIGTHTSKDLQTFYQQAFTPNKAAVSGYNIYHKDLLFFAKSLELTFNEIPEGNSQYFGGELREYAKSELAHVAVATKGASSKDLKEALVFCILQQAFGGSPLIRWGKSPSPLSKAISAVAPEAGASCINVNYSDTGLFGFMFSSSADNAGKVLQEGFKVLKSGSVSENDFKRAKAIVRMLVLSDCEKTENIVEDMSVQSLMGGIIIPGPVVAEAIEKVTLADVNSAAKKVASGKFSLAAYGNLSELPYLDQLK